MTLDLFILVLVGVFAFVGMLTGAAKQVAQWIGLAVGWIASRTLGPFAGPMFAKSAGVPLLIGTVAASFVIFILVMVATRYAAKVILRRILAGKDPQNRSADRFFGCILGGLKVAIITYVILSALSFVENNVAIAGKRIGFAPKDSYAFGIVRKYNLFEATMFSSVKDFAKVAEAATDPKKAAALREDPAYQALMKDQRFASAVKTDGIQRALDTGDTQALLRNANVLQLIQDPVASKRLAAAAAKAE